MRKNILKFKRWLRRGRAKPAVNTGGTRRRRRAFSAPGSFSSRKVIFLLIIILLVTAFIHSFYRFDRQILPLVLEEAELRMQTEINNVINSVVHEIIVASNVTAEDFILQHPVGPDGKPTLSVNTVLANEICNAAAQAISDRLNNLEPEIISVPLGMALGLDMLAQTGPRFTFTLAPVGNALVNYESSFTAVGINQTHFSVWLTVEAVVRIINPIQSSEIHVSRQVSLVDTVISGVVPETFLTLDGLGMQLP